MPSPSINQANTFSEIPSFVPVGVLWYTEDTLLLYAGTGISDASRNVVQIAPGGGLGAGSIVDGGTY